MVSQAALVGGIAIGVFVVLFLLLFYYCMVRHKSNPKSNHRFVGNNIELGGRNRRPNPLISSSRRRGDGYDDLEAAHSTYDQPPQGHVYRPQGYIPQPLLHPDQFLEPPQPVYAPASGSRRQGMQYSGGVGSQRGMGGVPQAASNRITPSPFASAQRGARGGGSKGGRAPGGRHRQGGYTGQYSGSTLG